LALKGIKKTVIPGKNAASYRGERGQNHSEGRAQFVGSRGYELRLALPGLFYRSQHFFCKMPGKKSQKKDGGRACSSEGQPEIPEAESQGLKRMQNQNSQVPFLAGNQ